jgi:hypothetical protein
MGVSTPISYPEKAVPRRDAMAGALVQGSHMIFIVPE